jgi:putative ABC transport system ATP-binding protein
MTAPATGAASERTASENTARDTTGDDMHMAETHEPRNTPAAASEPLYRLAGVTRTYPQRGRTVTALAGVDIDIAEGDFVAIQGPTGGGKSTLLQVLGALEKPTSGSIRLGGTDISTASSAELGRMRAEEIGFVFQGFNLIPTLSARENVDMALEPLNIGKPDRTARVEEALEHVGLADRADHLPGELSGGQQQRVAIARAIVKRPRVLLADEPTGNLDESMRDEILAVLETLNAEGLTLIVVTHDSAVARRAQRRLRLEKGTVREITP